MSWSEGLCSIRRKPRLNAFWITQRQKEVGIQASGDKADGLRREFRIRAYQFPGSRRRRKDYRGTRNKTLRLTRRCRTQRSQSSQRIGIQKHRGRSWRPLRAALRLESPLLHGGHPSRCARGSKVGSTVSIDRGTDAHPLGGVSGLGGVQAALAERSAPPWNSHPISNLKFQTGRWPPFAEMPLTVHSTWPC